MCNVNISFILFITNLDKRVYIGNAPVRLLPLLMLMRRGLRREGATEFNAKVGHEARPSPAMHLWARRVQTA